MTSFQNQHWIITGAAGGIGTETARLLVSEGANVQLWDVNEGRLKTLADELQCTYALVDCTDYERIRHATQSAKQHYGTLHGVVHCAGILHTGMFLDIPQERHANIITINLTGTLNVAHVVLPHLIETKGQLILLGSISAFQGAPEFASYAASKAAILNFAQAMRVELTGTGVNMGVVCPNFVNTGMLNEENRKNGAMVHSKSIFLKVYEAPDIARAIVRGIKRRRFLIYTDWRGAMIYHLSRYGAYMGYWLTLKTWRDAKKGIQ